jgi:phage/conjugal plasmid C-4 type zinc finger TraR family protein
MTEDERTEAAIQQFQDIALKQHQQSHITPITASQPYCLECGNEIPLARQQAIPGVTLCLECKQTAEKKERLIR